MSKVFKKTETVEEFLARGGKVKKLKAEKYDSAGNSRYTYKEKSGGFSSDEVYRGTKSNTGTDLLRKSIHWKPYNQK